MKIGNLFKLGFCLVIGCMSLGLSHWQHPHNGQESHQNSPSENLNSPRRPIAVTFTSDDKNLVIANRDTGTISVVSLSSRKVMLEKKIGEQLSDLARVDDTFLATDFAKNQLVSFQLKRDAEQNYQIESQTVSTIQNPVRIAISKNKQVCIAGLWSHRLQIFSLDKLQQIDSHKNHQLPFAPGSVCWGQGDEADCLFVGSAFSDQLICIRPAKSGEFEQFQHQLPGASIRDLQISPDGKHLWVVGQKLNKLARSTRNDIHWGLMLSNEIRSFEISNCFSNKKNSKLNPLQTIAIGSDENGKGDPAHLVKIDRDRSAIALAGVHQIAIRNSKSNQFKYIDAGKHPAKLAISTSGTWLASANTFSDSVTLVDLKNEKPINISLGSMGKLTSAQRGEQLFFDATLSHDGWLSCGSCHVRGHTNGLLNDNASDGSFDAPKLVISTLGRANTAPFAWNGNVKSLAQQVKNSIEKTMQSDNAADDQQVVDITNYLKQLAPPPSLYNIRSEIGDGMKKSVQTGQKLFNDLGCGECHAGKSYTSRKIVDVGLVDEVGARKFNPPSLLGVSQRTSYLHDGRAKSLDQLFAEQKHQLDQALTDHQRKALVNFLKTL